MYVRKTKTAAGLLVFVFVRESVNHAAKRGSLNEASNTRAADACCARKPLNGSVNPDSSNHSRRVKGRDRGRKSHARNST